MNHDVFISYSSKEKSIADGVCHYLEDNGVKCWMAPRDIPAGTDYGDLIDEAIKSCRVVVLVYSQHSFISKWVKGEINVAFDEGKPIAPFRIDETGIKGAFRVMLNQMHWIDAYPRYADRLPDLLRSICGFIGREVPNPQAPELHNPTVEEHLGPSQPTEAELHIEVDADCRVFRFGKEIMLARKGQDNVLMLQKGKHKLRFVSAENNNATEENVIEINGFSDFLEVNLSERIADLARRAREEAEYKAMEDKKYKIYREYIDKGYTIVGFGKTEITKTEVEALGDSIEKVRIADTVTEIEDFAFRNCWRITQIKIPNSVTHIGLGVFEGCSNITSINIPESVTYIDGSAFEDCRGLKTVVIPKSVNRIGAFAFLRCDNLETARLLNPNTEYFEDGFDSFPKHTKIIKG